MLNMSKSQFIETINYELLSTVTSIEEGQPMVVTLENGVGKVSATTGLANDFFCGVSFSRAKMPTTGVRVEEVVIPGTGPYTITLPRTPIGNPGAIILLAGANPRVFLTQNASASTTQYAIAGNVMTFHSSFAGRTVQLVYFHALTVAEAGYKFTFDAFSTTDFAALANIGIVTTGVIYTDQYDQTVDWSTWGNAVPVTLGNGKFTIGGSGAALGAVAVVSIPSVSDPFLGLQLNAR